MRILFLLVLFCGCARLPSPVIPIGEPIETSKIVQEEKERLDRHFDIRSFYTCYVSSRFGSSEIRQVILLRHDGSVRLETFPPQLIPHSLALFIAKSGEESVLLLQSEKKAIKIKEGITPITRDISVPLSPRAFLSLLLGFLPFDRYSGFMNSNTEQLIGESGLEIIRESKKIVSFNLRDNDQIVLVKGSLSDFNIIPRKVFLEIIESGTTIECRNQLIETHETLSDKPFVVLVPKGWD